MFPLHHIVFLSYIEQFLQTHIVSNVKRLYKNAKYIQIKLYKICSLPTAIMIKLNNVVGTKQMNDKCRKYRSNKERYNQVRHRKHISQINGYNLFIMWKTAQLLGEGLRIAFR